MDQNVPENVAAQLPALKALGNRIVNARTGEPVRLRGVNWSGFEYNRESRMGEAALDRIAGWGANLVRLPFNAAWAIGSEAYRCALDEAIAGAAERKMYTLLDLQWLDAQTVRGHLKDGRENFVPALPDRTAMVVWDLLARRYRTNPAVLYDIFNEPHDPLPDDYTFPLQRRRVDAGVWHEWASDLIRAIRAAHADALIFVSGLDWGYDLSSFPIAGIEDVVYSTHVYPHKTKNWERAFGKLSRTHPVFAAELGGENEHLDWGHQLMDYLDALEIGWAAWSWCDHPHLIAPGTEDEPTAFGALVRSRMDSPDSKRSV
ncbi:MAG TPA: cellulase family glycosylhydrolase [Bryobacteraceae bacterium]|jgi:aryl-phospho-beta-D-glucosidase BglC (GH1 family)|nr:cellulase family glycosylhydrolase [Bryobacteraceae bacterium]